MTSNLFQRAEPPFMRTLSWPLTVNMRLDSEKGMVTKMAEWLRFGIAAILIAAGVLTVAVGVFGLYRFKFVLNRMHAAAIGDTLGMLLILSGLIVINGLRFVSLKYVLVVVFFWMASPVASHLISRLEVTTNEHLDEHCEIRKDGE